MSYTKTIILCNKCHRCPCICNNTNLYNHMSCNCHNKLNSSKDTVLNNNNNNITTNNCNIKYPTCNTQYSNTCIQPKCKKCKCKSKKCIKTLKKNNGYCYQKCSCKCRPKSNCINPLWWVLLLFLI